MASLGDFLDKLGPTLTTGILLGVLTGTATTLMAWRDHTAASAVRFSGYDAELARLRADLDEFRKPGGRFTRRDGDEHRLILDDHERRLREQETRPPRLNPALVDAVGDIQELRDKVIVCTEALRHTHDEQERLCQRMQGCGWRPAK